MNILISVFATTYAKNKYTLVHVQYSKARTKALT